MSSWDDYTASSGFGGSTEAAHTITINGITTSGTHFTFNDTSEPTKKNHIKRIGPRLYFRYVKSKLKKMEQKKLTERLEKLSVLVEDALQYGQYAMHEELQKQLLETVRESEIFACGYETFITVHDISRFQSLVKEEDSNDKVVYFKQLEEFPRPLPKEVKSKLNQVKDKELFEQIWVLYLDYTEDSKKIKSTKKKIREKDPIMFGSFKGSNNYYFIVDWVDDVCDLTLDKIIDQYKITTSTIPTIDKKYVSKMKQRLEEQAKRLEETNSRNYKELMKQEELDRKKRKFWWQFWKTKGEK